MTGHATGPVKSREMPGRIRPQFVMHKGGHVAQFGCAVVAAGNDRRGHFQPPVHAPDGPEVVQHGLETAPAVLAIKIIAEGFQIHIDGIDPTAQGEQKVPAHKAVADQNDPQPHSLGQAGGFVEQLEKNRGLVIGKGHAARVLVFGQTHQRVRRDAPAGHHAAGRHPGDLVILAKATLKIAARAAHGKGSAARQKVIKGLFFHRIHLDAGDNVRHHGDQLPAAVDPYAAQSLAAFFQATGMCAQATAHIFVLQRFPEHGSHLNALLRRQRRPPCCSWCSRFPCTAQRCCAARAVASPALTVPAA